MIKKEVFEQVVRDFHTKPLPELRDIGILDGETGDLSIQELKAEDS